MTGDRAHGWGTGYVCPPDAGPAWRQAVAEGVDMSLVEHCLGKSVWDRLRDHDRALRFARLLHQSTKARSE